MTEHLKHWKLAAERLVSAIEIEWREAARLATEIAGHTTDPLLRQAATQAIPVLRNAALGGGEHDVVPAARRRFLVLLDTLQKVSMPRFGTRRARPKPLTAEERARKILQLPLGTRLAAPEIRQAFRRAAKMAHPDATGGSHEAFRELIAAQEMLMRPYAHSGE